MWDDLIDDMVCDDSWDKLSLCFLLSIVSGWLFVTLMLIIDTVRGRH